MKNCKGLLLNHIRVLWVVEWEGMGEGGCGNQKGLCGQLCPHLGQSQMRHECS